MSFLMKGIDVSVHQGNVNWEAVKTGGVDYAIIRAGYGRELSQKDKQFENNYTGCKANNIPVGAYWYSYALTVEDAVREAKLSLKCLRVRLLNFQFILTWKREVSLTLENKVY